MVLRFEYGILLQTHLFEHLVPSCWWESLGGGTSLEEVGSWGQAWRFKPLFCSLFPNYGCRVASCLPLLL